MTALEEVMATDLVFVCLEEDMSYEQYMREADKHGVPFRITLLGYTNCAEAYMHSKSMVKNYLTNA